MEIDDEGFTKRERHAVREARKLINNEPAKLRHVEVSKVLKQIWIRTEVPAATQAELARTLHRLIGQQKKTRDAKYNKTS